jgi:cysteine synthase B
MIYKSIFELIGNTPMVEIPVEVHQIENLSLFCKLEYYNPFGSLKDRMALEMIKDQIEDLKKGKIVIENSSGNTAKALQIIASIYGNHLKTITNRIKNPEKKEVLQLLGAEIEELPGKSQCYDPSDPNDPLVHVEREMNSHPSKYIYTNQYFNQKNVKAHYKNTGREIIKDLGMVDYFFSGLGTTGSTKGISQALKEKNKKTQSIGIIAQSDNLIPGIRNAKEMFEVGLFEKKIYDRIMEVSTEEAIDGSIELIRKTGILIGPTGGASYAAIKKYFKDKKIETKVNAVFLACDRFEWYLSYYKKYKPAIFQEEFKKDSVYLHQINNEESLDISIDDLLNKIKKEPEKLLIIDIRTNIAYKFGHLNDSINIPEQFLNEIIDRSLPFPKEKIIIFVCPTGERSRFYASYLKKQGYQSFSLAGGILKWQERSLPLAMVF